MVGVRRIEGFDLMVVVVLLLVGAATLYPVVNVFSISLSHPNEVARGITWLPRHLDLSAYEFILEHPMIGVGYRNSLIYVTIGTAINLTMTCLCAYPLSKKGLVGRKFVMLLIVFTMFFSGGLIPTYLLVRALGMVNTMWALLIPGAIAAYNMIILRTFFQSIPEDLEESAFLDGAGRWRILASIILPLSKAGLAAIGLFYALGHWNSYFNALIYLNDAEKYPLTMIVREIVLQEVVLKRQELSGDVFDAEREMKFAAYTQNFRYATVFVSIIPMLIIYPFLQRYFVQGLMIGSLKE
ncbi:MAG: carbohydrate ABC transporter permease [Spirochaetaceae bacterium]|nr:carbohydrate ABC transporter permease [Spirochaetaceae bacterium]